MSERHGNGNAQWTKTSAHKQQNLSTSQVFDHSPTLLAHPNVLSNVLYSGGTVTHPHLYGTARFQPPPIHHVSGSPTPTLGVPSTITSSNVPAPSGFVPPPFPPIAATTSVLTPNPFVLNASGNMGPHSHFSLEQFQHLNPQQQVELSKIMSAMSTTTSNTIVNSCVGTAGAGAPLPLETSTTLQQPSQASQPKTPTITQAVRHTVNTPTCGGAISNSIADSVRNAIGVATHSSTNVMPSNGRLSSVGVKVPDAEKMRRIQQVVESGIGDHAKQQIVQILDRVSTLKPAEKLLLYLRLPGDGPETDPLRHPQNPLGTRSEINYTINWVRTHLEQDPQVSIPKQDVYTDYLTYCERLDIKPLSTADFGKVMKQVFPGIRPRRLGTRGHSRYCYAAMRKATKLTVPQLPQLKATTACGSEVGNESGPFGVDDESWEIIKVWAETILNVKVDNVKDLVARIKTNNISGGPIPSSARSNVNQKKYTPREPKEKRSLSDTGPIKKRRKKKRKGSSSPESLSNQPMQEDQKMPPTENNQHKAAISNSDLNTPLCTTSQDEPKPLKMLKIKEEIVESPTTQHVHPTPQMQMTKVDNMYLHQQPHQMLPMNLATEQRTALSKSQMASNSFLPVNEGRSPFAAAKNLTPKIMEIATAAADRSSNVSSSIPVINSDQMSIKEEAVEDYHHANIFCKKVRKAQQTKGFWNNSPTPNNNNIPTITTSSVPASINNTSVICTASSTSQTAGTDTGTGSIESGVESSVTNYLMGPPVNTIVNASVSPSNALHDASATPKVASRNMILLRAKKQQHIADATSDMGVDKDADLPENLGLPRERVISICNMDKHELDDYLMSGEEENSQDQDTELLQYFQTGDAEEKVNSLDAARLRNPTATQTSLITDESNPCANDSATQKQLKRNDLLVNSNKLAVSEASAVTANATLSSAVRGLQNSITNSSFDTTEITSPAVGSASASLALMSQKHQEQQKLNNIGHKRKINFDAKPMNDGNLPTPRKNCIFLPISPNINSTAIVSGNATDINGAGVSCFASPGLKRLRPKPSFSKQQSLDVSLDCESSDPMIGACYRRRNYINPNSMSTNTSASAPPSPSVLQQQQQIFGNTPQFLNHQWHMSSSTGYSDRMTNTSASLAEQNSLDLDLFSTSSGTNPNLMQNTLQTSSFLAGNCQMAPLSETQRSQSVPLAQLQRIHSPTFSRATQANFSACTSVTQTPVPPEFVDSTTIFSENSCSQHSVGGANGQLNASTIKLEDEVALASHSTTIFDEVDVSEILSPGFVKFTSIAHVNTPATTCSSGGSSSGYSSVGPNITFGSAGCGGGGGIVSRSVPSTPLPHQQNFYGRRKFNEDRLSPTLTSPNVTSAFASTVFKYGCSSASRSIYDMSKSMPTTPITTPCFRYSPTEFNRDFLINGNTIDSIASFGGGMGNDSLLCSGGDSMDMGMGGFNTDSLMDDSGAPTETFGSSAVIANDTESIMVGSDILGGL